MKSAHFSFEAEDGKKIFVYQWLPAGGDKPRAVVQIAHGMAEHAGRYERFANALVGSGFLVYANDHRGHGRTAAPEELGYFAERDGWSLVVADMRRLTGIIHGEHPDLPVFLFGHSMGSFLARSYTALYGNELSGLILSGTGDDPGLLGRLGVLLAHWEKRRKGGRGASPFLTCLVFARHNARFKPMRTEFDWLSREKDEVDKYIEDPLCGFMATTGLFFDLFSGVKESTGPANLLNLPKTLPYYLISGDNDPVGSFGKGVRQVFRAFQKAGIRDVKMKLYAGGRHEMLNETNREEVFRDVIEWLQSNC